MTNPKTYYRPKTLAEAVERAVQPGSLALAGGALTLGQVMLPYETVIDLQDLVEIQQISQDDTGLHIGGGVRLQAVVESPLVPDALQRALTRTLPLNLRNGASVGESLIVNDPPREWLAMLAALDAQVEHAGQLNNPDPYPLWEQSLEEFVDYLHLHRHPYHGIITQIQFAPTIAHLKLGAAYVSRTPADAPIVNAAVALAVDNRGKVSSAVAGIGGAAHIPVMRLELETLMGSVLNEANVVHAAGWASSQVHPVGDYGGSAEYRIAMARVTVERALRECMG